MAGRERGEEWKEGEKKAGSLVQVLLYEPRAQKDYLLLPRESTDQLSIEK